MAPFGHWNSSAFITALCHDRIDAPWVINGPLSGDIFCTCVEQVPVPMFGSGDIVVMDNPGGHQSRAVRYAIRLANARLLFLPPFSPDLTPIDQPVPKRKPG
ncbi:MAG: transposase [Pseudomonadota bacterium]